jgi:tetratricopeptide (TPR) repeat protein
VASANLEELAELGAQTIAEEFYSQYAAVYLYQAWRKSRDEPAASRLDAFIDRSLSTGDRRKVSLAWTLQGLRAAAEGNYDLAIEHYVEANEIDQQNVGALLNWAEALTKQGKRDDAIEKYKMIVADHPRFADAYVGWGNLLARRPDDRPSAIEMYRKAIELKPGDSTPYNNWGYVLDSLGKYDEAIQRYQKGRELNPRDALVYLNWGYALFKKNDIAGAIQKTHKAIDLDPKEARAYSNLCFLLNIKKEFKAAVEQCTKAVERDPKNADAYFNWGNALRGLDDQSGAVDKYRKVVELDHKYKAAYDGAAAALKSLGKNAEAEAMVQAARNAGAI